MRKKILIPTDFSKSAWNALVYATELYAEVPCDFYVMNFYQPVGYDIEPLMAPSPGDQFYDISKRKSEGGLAETMAKIKVLDTNEHHTFKESSSFNSILEGVADAIDRHDFDMIIMGTKGDSDRSNILFGSNAIILMENVHDCPVLTVPLNAVFQEFEEIVFPVDFTVPIKKREINYVRELVHITKANLKILYVAEKDSLNEKQQNNKRLLEENLEDLPYEHHQLHLADANKGVIAFTESRKSDMIIFINKKHTFFQTVFSKPMVKNLGYFSKIPVLALHDTRN